MTARSRRRLALAIAWLATGATAVYLAIRPPTSRIRVACVGDSITAGEGVADPAMRYPAS
jgi:hypothetical protein